MREGYYKDSHESEGTERAKPWSDRIEMAEGGRVGDSIGTRMGGGGTRSPTAAGHMMMGTLCARGHWTQGSGWSARGRAARNGGHVHALSKCRVR